MKQLFYLIIIFGFLACNNEPSKQSMKMNKQPNIVIIYTDDQGYGDLSSFGSMSMKTPNIEN